MFKLPGCNFHELNLDWVLERLKKFEANLKEYENRLKAIEDVFDPEEFERMQDELRTLINTYNIFHDEVIDRFDANERDIASLKTRCNVYEQDLAQLETKLEAAELSISTLENKMEAAELSISTVENDIADIKIEQTTQNNRLAALEQGGGGGGGSVVAVLPKVTSGDNIADITINGVVNHLYAKKYSTVSAEAKTTTGTEIATITVNGTTKSIKNGIDPATLGDKVSFTPALSSGTEVGTININGTDQKIYAPAGGGGGDSGHGDGTLGWSIGTIGTEKIDYTHEVDYCPIKYNTDNGMLIIPSLSSENFHIWGKVALGFDFVVASITIPNGYRIRFMMDMVRQPYAGEWLHMGVNVTIEKSAAGEISTNVTRNYWDVSGSEGYMASQYPNVIYGIIEPV